MARPGLDGTGTRSPGTMRWDASHHRMVSWDDHPACWSCLNKMGVFCSESEPCDVCVWWGLDQWQKIRRALTSARRRQVRADHSNSEAVRPQSVVVIGSRASIQSCGEARPRLGLEARTRRGLTRPRSKALDRGRVEASSWN